MGDVPDECIILKMQLKMHSFQLCHKMNLRGQEIINGDERRQKQSSTAQMCLNFLDFSLIFPFFCEILDTFILWVSN